MDLTNQFLIAMPNLRDPTFHRTVTYLCVHNSNGAMGIIINRPLSLTLADVLKHMDIEIEDPSVNDIPVFQGGPVQPERGFVIHKPSGRWDAVLAVGDDISVATSRDILTSLAKGEGPENVTVALGYAGWGAGQLEKELGENTWLSGPADASIIFDVSYQDRWQSATKFLGIDPNLISGVAGHG